MPVHGGLGWGNISIDEKEFTPGTYTISAYTTLMRNFGNDYFFNKSIYITGQGEKNWLINQQQSTLSNNSSANVKLQLSNMNGMPEANTQVQLQVFAGNKYLYKQKLLTDQNGLMDFNVKFPEKESNLVIKAESEAGDKQAIIPIYLNQYKNADIQFLPEGGNLVAGLPAHIGVKAIGEDGKGLAISGIITDRSQKQVATFKSLHNGMGSFDMNTVDADGYTARVNLPSGVTKEYLLPTVKSTGAILQVKILPGNDSLELSVGATKDIAQSGANYFLIGKARGIICYAAIVNFREGSYVKRKIAKSLFPTGVTHFTLMTASYQPVNERPVFIDRGDNLNIKVTPDKPFYDKRDSIALKLKVTDGEGNPVQGKFSMAVTDDAQVKTDTLNNENILSRLLLTADLKGYVEEPGYYVAPKSSEALDNLLLTQGWVGYDWKQVFNPPVIAYHPERDFEVKGHVTNAFNKTLKGTDVLLFSKSPSILMDTTTDKEGKFVFNRFPRVDTPVFVLKAVNKNGKSFNVGITVDEVKPPDFVKPFSPLNMPWYVNSDSTLLKYAKNAAAIKQQENFPAGGHILKEVNIKAKKMIRDSQNLNGPGNADLVLDEKDMEAAGKKTWLQLLQENVKGFREGTFVGGASLKSVKDRFLDAYVTDIQASLDWYFIDGKPIKLIVDGISVNKIITSIPTVNGSFITLRNYLESHSAEDIKGIEIMHTSKYTAQYLSRYDPGDVIIAALNYNPPISIAPSDIAFVEITTRSGHGPVIDNTPGMYLYKPLPISWPKQFYKPRYAVRDTAKHLADLRSTIDWEPNINTNANGEATISFYSAGKASTYTLILEGTDLNGNFGFKCGKVIIGTSKPAKTLTSTTGK